MSAQSTRGARSEQGGPAGQDARRRFLFVVPPLVGHINPAVGVAASLAAGGHRVAWAGLPECVVPLAGEGAEVFPCAVPAAYAEGGQRPPELRGTAAFKFLWEQFFVPLAEAMAPGVRAAVEEFRPHVVVADQQALAGGLIAERLGVPWATLATTSAELTSSLSGVPKVEAWVEEMIQGLRERVGAPEGTADPRFSPHLVVAFTTPELAGPAVAGGGNIRCVGPSLAARPAMGDFPWEWLDDSRATVLVSLGTANDGAGTRFLRECAEALRARSDRLQAVIVDPDGALGDSDEHVLVRRRVPQLPLLERADAVVCHAGHNTVCEVLWNGLPLVVAPIRDDQPIVAGQVAEAGAGIRVRFTRVRAAQLGTAVDTVLEDKSYRAAADGIARSFRAAGGSDAAAAGLLELTGS